MIIISEDEYKLDNDIKKAIDGVQSSIDKLSKACNGFKVPNNEQMTAQILTICKDMYDQVSTRLGTISNMLGDTDE